jgi:hypothetical protein
MLEKSGVEDDGQFWGMFYFLTDNLYGQENHKDIKSITCRRYNEK